MTFSYCHMAPQRRSKLFCGIKTPGNLVEIYRNPNGADQPCRLVLMISTAFQGSLSGALIGFKLLFSCQCLFWIPIIEIGWAGILYFKSVAFPSREFFLSFLVLMTMA